MIGTATKIETQQIKTLERLADKGVFKSLGNAAAAIRNTARTLIVRSSEPSQPGEPIHTKKGKAKRPDAILFAADDRADEAVVGFSYAVMQESMSAHEIGGDYLGTEFPERPTIRPALDVNLVRFAEEFRGSIGE
jgi:hypothetical protein